MPASPPNQLPGSEPSALIAELEDIQQELQHCVPFPGIDPASIHPHFQLSARNLMQYLTLRRRDLRPLQTGLSELGLSSLGRSESHVLTTIDTVLWTLRRLADRHDASTMSIDRSIDIQTGRRLLREHSDMLLGELPGGGSGHIMVTMPTEAAEDYALVQELLRCGMTCMRINCAHDNPDTWSAMIANLRQAEERLGRRCKVSMDLAGPKLRTGPVASGPAVLKLRPRRDAWGRIVEPATLWLTAEADRLNTPLEVDACLSVEPSWLAGLERGDRVKLRDTRGKKRSMAVLDRTSLGCLLGIDRTLYLSPETLLHLAGARGRKARTAIGGINGRPARLTLRPGDHLVLTSEAVPGTPAIVDESGRTMEPAIISCTLPEVLSRVRQGEEVWFDDGRIGGIVDQVENGRLLIRIVSALPDGSKLGADKGINFPSSSLQLPAMTEKDREDLKFAAAHADIVALSFANNIGDVEALISLLREYGNTTAGIVLKIETVAGFRNLPAMLFKAMSMPSCGIMIARGDLAVEMGFARLAEVQEEILWLCEAAHVPVIWATQVLENLAKHGAPTRAEITDAAMGHRAECVMLNKGPHVISAVKTLDDILRRMQGHQAKKGSMLRELHVAETCFPDHAP